MKCSTFPHGPYYGKELIIIVNIILLNTIRYLSLSLAIKSESYKVDLPAYAEVHLIGHTILSTIVT